MVNTDFFISETFIAIVFFIFIAIFLLYKRKKVSLQKMLFPVIYMVLYRTKWGLKFMDGIAKKHPKAVKYISYSGVFVCFAGMALTAVYLLYMFFKAFMGSSEAAIAIAQPFVKTSYGSPFFYIPFTYFIVAVFIIAVVHEVSHGIVSRLFKVRLKSSGFAFFSFFIPILPAAFVEPDEKQIKKLKPMKQLAIFAAGPFSNLILAGIVLLSIFAINPALSDVTDTDVVVVDYTRNADNTTYPAEKAGINPGEAIIQIDDIEIDSVKTFVNFMENTTPDQEVDIVTNESEYDLVLSESPDNKTGYLGVMVNAETDYNKEFKDKFGLLVPIIDWITGLLVLLFIFNLGVGLINLAPIGPLDGGRMMLTLLCMKFPEKKATKIWAKITLFFLFILLADIFLPWILGLF